MATEAAKPKFLSYLLPLISTFPDAGELSSIDKLKRR